MHRLWLAVVLLCSLAVVAQTPVNEKTQQAPATTDKQQPAAETQQKPAQPPTEFPKDLNVPKDAFKLEAQPEQDNKKADGGMPTFKSRSELVLVPSLVRKSGKHVPNLQKDDFLLLENNAPQHISVFEEIRTTANPLIRPKLIPDAFTNAVISEKSTSGPQRLTIIALDTINTPVREQTYAREQLVKFLEKAAERREPTSLMVLTRFGVKVIHDFTTNPAVLIAALRRTKGSAQQVVDSAPSPSADAMSGWVDSMNNAASNSQSSDDMAKQAAELAQKLQDFQKQAEQSFQAFQQRVAIQYTLEGLQQIAQAYAGVPGRKALIWASAGFPFSVQPQTFELQRGDDIHDVLPLYERTWKILNSSNMSVYPVDVRGLVNSAYVGPSSAGLSGKTAADQAKSLGQQMMSHQDTIASFTQVADMTGGRAFVNRNDLDVCFDDAVNDSADYYLLGYYLRRTAIPPSSSDEKDQKKQKKVSKVKLDNWRKLQVRMATLKGVDVRARSGFYAEKHSDPAAGAEAEVREAIFAPIDYTAIEISGRWVSQKEGKDGKKLAEFLLYLPPNFATLEDKRISVDFLAAAKSPEGQLVAQAGQRLNRVIPEASMEGYRNIGTQYRYLIELAPGEYQVRFIVRDNNSDRIGSVTAPLKVEK